MLCLDSDSAGEEASAYLTEELPPGNPHLKLNLPNGKDVNDCYLMNKEELLLNDEQKEAVLTRDVRY